jgi:gliding motility-associated-like protein
MVLGIVPETAKELVGRAMKNENKYLQLQNRSPMKIIRLLLLSTITLLTTYLGGQDATIQDCLGAIPVCQQIYVEELSPSGDGNVNNEINTNISCTAGELNSIWYTFTMDQDGDFGFLIIPNDPDDDYDWSLFNITDASCEDIFSDPDLVVSCNAAGGIGCHGPTGANGGSAFAIQGAGCNSFPPNINFGDSPFNDFVPVQEGNTYVLMVSNWSGSPNGYTLDLGLGNVSVFDNEDPVVEEVDFPDDCFETEIVITFSEFIQCSSIDELNFLVIGPSGPLSYTLLGNNCDNGGTFEKVFTLDLDAPVLELGDYQFALLVDNATEALDLCDNPTAPVDFTFTVNQALGFALDLGPDEVDLCTGDSLVLDATNPLATYLWQDGSDQAVYTVYDEGVYYVEVENACGGISDTVTVNFADSAPLVDLGPDDILCEGNTLILDATNDLATYTWQDGSEDPTFEVTAEGTYEVIVVNPCGVASDEVFLDLIPAIDLDLPDEAFICDGDTLLLDVSNEVATYLWQDGAVSPTYQATTSGLYEVMVTTVCESLSDSVSLTVTGEQPYDLGADTLLCAGDTLFIGEELEGGMYEWQDGSTNAIYSVVSPGTYTVTVTDACSVVQDFITVDFIPAINYDLGDDQFLCENQVFLDAATPGLANYEWQDGSILPFIVAAQPGIYSVRVYNQCEEVIDQVELFECEQCDVYFPNVFSPNLDGYNDVFFPLSDCELLDYELVIFDRWGAMVFQSNDPKFGWDGNFRGERMPQGVYVWSMNYTVIENLIPRQVNAAGSVTVLR